MLFDSGATHSFISTMFDNCLGRNKDNIRQTFRTVLPTGDIMLSNYWLRIVLVVIFERELSIDLVVLDMVNYDVILGMNFLSKYKATIDCKARVVSFQPPNEKRFVFVDDRCSTQKMFISAMKVRKWLASEYTGYLATVVDMTKMRRTNSVKCRW